MPLPVNIKELINGRAVEWERIEFKEGWNPIRVLHTICAFANDINNWGGGYIIIGISEENGRPVLPPKGIPIDSLDIIQKELLNLCNRIRLPYFPKVAPVDFQDRTLLVIWVPTGPARPYEAPETLTKGAPYYSYIRRFASTVKANTEERKELLGLSNHIPFDDQTNHNSALSDLSLTLIKQFLREINSALLEEADNMPFAELCRAMNIVDGPDEYVKPKNVGLLFFSSNPQQYFPSARIEVVEFSNEDGTDFIEKVFAGPLIDALRSSLLYIKNMYIKEKVHKVDDKAEAERWFNYPYSAIEEALVNAIYHRSYRENAPVEVRIYPSRIEIISYPGPMPPLNNKNIGKISCRRYRNSRIGDFLKELHLTEGKGTGIPKIQKALKNNDSPEAVFDTDDERSYFIATIYIHPKFKKSS
ncbi:MAG: putative DNA binding domain-containing protein, partial [Acidobacteria bacterium]|nr:putative DNA binding domain-containing protein [Acidobacteriota bacterium]